MFNFVNESKKGLLIVIEGIDGSGKTTQINLLAKALEDQKIPYEVISFPRYGDNIYADLVTRYLEGEFGSISEVNPYLISLTFAGDRLLAKLKIDKWLAEGKLVLANRYVSSNKAHLGANLPEEKREEFLKWLDELEYEINGIPREDLTILLTIDPTVGQQNVSGENHPDLHEQNLKHLEEANKIYLELAKKENNWKLVDCMEGDRMRRPEEINRELVRIVEQRLAQ